MLQLFDAHVHLTDLVYEPFLQSIIAGMRALNIVACSVAVDSETSRRGVELKKGYPDVIRNFVGIHPEAAERKDSSELADLVHHNLKYVDGIGEIGLDPTYEERGIAALAKQKEIFGTMLSLAERYAKPVSVHSRKSLDEILSILPSYNVENVQLHWFAGNKNQLTRASERGLYVSFGPAMVYSGDKRTLIQLADRERVLIETDGPVEYSRCFRGLAASPTAFLVSVMFSASEALSLTYQETASLIERNTLRYLACGQR